MKAVIGESWYTYDASEVKIPKASLDYDTMIDPEGFQSEVFVVQTDDILYCSPLCEVESDAERYAKQAIKTLKHQFGFETEKIDKERIAYIEDINEKPNG